MIKAVSLISGGLDSTLATKVILDQGVDVVAANYISPFCRCNRKQSGDRAASGCRHEAKFVSENLKIPLKLFNISEEFLEIIKSPKHGFGSHMNPCIDCRILMLKKAKVLMEEERASFLVTGEVVGQRPMSQKRHTIRLIEKEAGLQRLILRPLSAKLLEPTIPEEEGWVDRDKLLNISGRGRRAQMQLAETFHINDYPCPAGGCLLTDPGFSRRMEDLVKYGELTMKEVHLLKIGRHFRLSQRSKLIVGRNERDNEALEALLEDEDCFFSPDEATPGASALGRGDFSDPETLLLAARIVSRYFDKKPEVSKVRVCVRGKAGEGAHVIEPFSDEEAKKYLI